MSKRRNAHDWVWLLPGSGFVGESNKLKAQIQDDGYESCFLCGDKDCKEWATLWTEPDASGERHPLYHVSECQMLDEPFKENKND